jgi:hypothetical protein
MGEVQVSPSVYGIETEYSCLIDLPGGTSNEIVGVCHSVDGALGLDVPMPEETGFDQINIDAVRQALGSLGIRANICGMLTNGGRLYADQSGPEYASAEARTAEEAVLRSFDGDMIMFKVLRYLQEQQIIEGFQLNRRGVDHSGVSRGTHLNTFTHLDADNLALRFALTTLNVAKGALFGSGGLLINEQGKSEYHYSPRLSVTTHEANENWLVRSLVRLPFKDDVGGKRIETVSGDALNFPWPLRASMVITNAVVGAVELDAVGVLPLINPAMALHGAHTVGKDGHNSHISILTDRSPKLEPSLSVLMRICEAVLRIDEQYEYLDDESRQVIPEIIETIDMVRDDPLSAVYRVESIARKHVMERKLDGLSLDTEKACRVDYAWDWVGGAGYAEALRNNERYWHGFTMPNTPSARAKRLVTPPQDTRAVIRASWISNAPEHAQHDESDWDSIEGLSQRVGPLDTDVVKAS